MALNGSKVEVAMVEVGAEVMVVVMALNQVNRRAKAITQFYLFFFKILKKALKLEGSVWSHWIFIL